MKFKKTHTGGELLGYIYVYVEQNMRSRVVSISAACSGCGSVFTKAEWGSSELQCVLNVSLFYEHFNC